MIKIKTYNMNLFNKGYRDMFGIREFEIYSYLHMVIIEAIRDLRLS